MRPRAKAIRRHPERARELTCTECGYAGEADERWIAHDPDESMWVYECPECGEFHHVGPPPWTPPPIDG